MSEEKISAHDLRDFEEGHDGPAAELYRHCLKKMIELIDGDLRVIFLTDLIRHAKGMSKTPMEQTFETFGKIQELVAEEATGLEAHRTFIEPV